jgi:16S rRNA (guanine(966)-N(2))-methyltransferase RsmD
MRIITGKFKKANLYSVPGMTARPTTDYVKELIFSVIGSFENKRILDLYAGSGGLGLEAISRGAAYADFVDFAQNSVQTIIRNIEKLKCQEYCHVYRKKVDSYIKKTENRYDFIFLDPPYDKNLVNKTLAYIDENKLLKESGFIIVEHAAAETIDANWQERISTTKKAGDTMITILGAKIEDL